jgi:hypothetical protein
LGFVFTATARLPYPAAHLVIFRRILQFYIRFDSHLMDYIAIGEKLLHNGQLQRVSAGKLFHALDDPLSVGRGSHKLARLMILHRSHKDFRRTGSTPVDQDQ